eukprot:2085851-Amphidinium_carterae.1
MAGRGQESKGKGRGPRLALPTLSGGLRLADLPAVRSTHATPIDTQTLPGIASVIFETTANGTCSVTLMDSG